MIQEFTVVVAKGGTTKSETLIPPFNSYLVGLACVVPTLEDATTATVTITHPTTPVLSVASIPLWSPAAFAAKTAGTYFTYAAEESAAPKPLNGIPIHASQGATVTVTCSGAQSTAARTFKFVAFLENL